MTDSPPIEMNADNPVKMSHMPNNRKPMFRLNFIRSSFSLKSENSGDLSYPFAEPDWLPKKVVRVFAG